MSPLHLSFHKILSGEDQSNSPQSQATRFACLALPFAFYILLDPWLQYSTIAAKVNNYFRVFFVQIDLTASLEIAPNTLTDRPNRSHDPNVRSLKSLIINELRGAAGRPR